MEKQVQKAPEYEKPEIRDYGDLKELTESTGRLVHVDLPLGSPLPPGGPAFAFS